MKHLMGTSKNTASTRGFRKEFRFNKMPLNSPTQKMMKMAALNPKWPPGFKLCMYDMIQDIPLFVPQWGNFKNVHDHVSALTFDAATAGLQHPGVHVHPGLGHQLVAHQVGVVRGGDEVVAQRLVHVLVHFVVLGVEDVARRAASVVRDTWKEVGPLLIITFLSIFYLFRLSLVPRM